MNLFTIFRSHIRTPHVAHFSSPQFMPVCLSIFAYRCRLWCLTRINADTHTHFSLIHTVHVRVRVATKKFGSYHLQNQSYIHRTTASSIAHCAIWMHKEKKNLMLNGSCITVWCMCVCRKLPSNCCNAYWATFTLSRAQRRMRCNDDDDGGDVYFRKLHECKWGMFENNFNGILAYLASGVKYDPDDVEINLL